MEEAPTEAIQIALGVIQGSNNNSYARIMRGLVDMLSIRKAELFATITTNFNGDTETFTVIVDEVFSDCNINWGRIIAVYTLLYHLSKKRQDSLFNSDVNVYAMEVKFAIEAGTYIEAKLGTWIAQVGGWPAFAEHFSEPSLFCRLLKIITTGL